MVRRVVVLALALMMLLGMSGCVVRRVDTGPKTSEVYPVSGFDSVDFSGFGTLEVEQGDEYGLELTGSTRELERVEVEVRGDTLHIRQKSRWTLWFWDAGGQRIDVRLTVPELRELVVSGAGEVDVEGLEGDEFRFELSGAGEFSARDIDVRELSVTLSGASSAQLNGSADSQSVVISGAGDYDGRDLESDEVRVDISGASSATVWAKETLDITTSGAASVDYYGSPEVTTDVSGAGSITARDAK